MLEIRKLGDPVLRRQAKPVRKVSAGMRKLLSEMAETMYAANGAGLAAPQVGVLKRAIVADVGEGLIELVNPEVVGSHGEETAMEGCLSIPDLVGEVSRAASVVVSGLDRCGRRAWVEGTGVLSRVLQHEIDHLDGVLFLDKASRVQVKAPEPADETGG